LNCKTFLTFWIPLVHPDILSQAALLPKPNLYKELRDMGGLTEERMAVLTERRRPNIGAINSQRIWSSNIRQHKRASGEVV
jgi:hypothetical protein